MIDRIGKIGDPLDPQDAVAEPSNSPDPAPVEPAEYKVGDRRPPKHTQWKPGQSGNRAGRPRGRKSFKTELREVIEQPIAVSQNGAKSSVSARMAMLLALRQKALAGDQAAMDRLFRLMHQHLPEEDVRDTAKAARDDEDFLRQLIADGSASEV